MKKLLALALTLALLLVSAFAVAETATEVATLYLTAMSTDGGENFMDTTGIMEVSFAFYGDGTVNMVAYGESVPGTYTTDGDSIIISMEDSNPITLVPVDETTYMASEEEQVMLFSTIQPEGIKLPEVVAADDITAFDGTWNPDLVSALGMTFSMEEATASGLGDLLGEEFAAPIVIENGKATIFGEEMAFEFVDGALSFDTPLMGENVTMTISLCEDGSIVYDMASLGITFYYTK